MLHVVDRFPGQRWGGLVLLGLIRFGYVGWLVVFFIFIFVGSKLEPAPNHAKPRWKESGIVIVCVGLFF